MSLDIHSSCAQPFSGDEKGLLNLQSSLSQKQTSELVSQGLVDELGEALGEPLNMRDPQEFGCASDGDGTSDTEEGIGCVDLKLKQASLAEKCLSKSATFSAPVKMTTYYTSSEDEDEDEGKLDDDLETALKDIFSEESDALPLVSAMKGSREKLGASPRKLTVKWAPDVYDPPPTILSHTLARGKKQQKSRKDKKNGKDNKKNGKDKQKGGGNSSRGANGKDKKNYRKIAGSSNRCYKSLDAHDRLVGNGFDDFDDDHDGFDVGSPDSYCGGSFLKKSPNKVHYSVAEAL